MPVLYSSLPKELFSGKTADTSAYATYYSIGPQYMAQINPKFPIKTELNTVIGIVTLTFKYLSYT